MNTPNPTPQATDQEIIERLAEFIGDDAKFIETRCNALYSVLKMKITKIRDGLHLKKDVNQNNALYSVLQKKDENC